MPWIHPIPSILAYCSLVPAHHFIPNSHRPYTLLSVLICVLAFGTLVTLAALVFHQPLNDFLGYLSMSNANRIPNLDPHDPFAIFCFILLVIMVFVAWLVLRVVVWHSVESEWDENSILKIYARLRSKQRREQKERDRARIREMKIRPRFRARMEPLREQDEEDEIGKYTPLLNEDERQEDLRLHGSEDLPMAEGLGTESSSSQVVPCVKVPKPIHNTSQPCNSRTTDAAPSHIAWVPLNLPPRIHAIDHSPRYAQGIGLEFEPVDRNWRVTTTTELAGVWYGWMLGSKET